MIAKKVNPNHSREQDGQQGRNKDTHFQTQKKQVFAAFYKHPKTMLMVSIETNILRANITRYISEFRKSNAIRFVRIGICPISKHRAGFFTTNMAIVEPLKNNSHE